MTAEDKIHWGLVVLLGATVVGLRLSDPPPPRAEPSEPEPSWEIGEAREIQRDELDAAIARLDSWIERTTAQTPSPRATLLGWQALGLRAIERERAQRFAPVFALDPIGTLVVLLEAGLSPETELGAGSDAAPLARWAAHALQERAKGDRPSLDASELDLSSLVTLAGGSQQRDRLGKLTRRGLAALDRRKRALPWRAGHEIDPADRALLAAAWNDGDARRERLHDLALSAAVFRAVAVLGERELLLSARRHLNTLLLRYSLERTLRATSLRDSTDSTRMLGARSSAVEELGRLEQALFNAHLAFRASEGAPPPERLGRTMRQAALELVTTLDGLSALSPAASSALRESPDLDLIAAAVQALRGLRTARAAT